MALAYAKTAPLATHPRLAVLDVHRVHRASFRTSLARCRANVAVLESISLFSTQRARQIAFCVRQERTVRLQLSTRYVCRGIENTSCLRVFSFTNSLGNSLYLIRSHEGNALGLDKEELCFACAPGRFSEVEGATTSQACSACAAGKQKPDAGKGICEDCGAGKYSGEASILCAPCKAGDYSTSNTSSTCKECE